MFRTQRIVPLFLLAFLLGLSGCMHMEIKARLKPDGGAFVVYRLGMDPKIMSPTPEGDTLEMDRDDPLKVPYWKTSGKEGVRVVYKGIQDYTDGRRFTETACEADRVTAFSDDEETVSYDTLGGKRHLVWRFKCFDPGGSGSRRGKLDGEDQKARAYFARFHFDFELEMPGLILTAPGADSVRGKKAFYHRTFADLMESDFTAEATSER